MVGFMEDEALHLIIHGGLARLNPSQPLIPQPPFLSDTWQATCKPRVDRFGFDIEWQQLHAVPSSAVPAARAGHAAVIINTGSGRTLAVYGGYASELLEPTEFLELFNLETRQWSELVPSPGQPWPGKFTFGMTFQPANNTIGINGGLGALFPRKIRNSTWIGRFTETGVSWSQASIQKPVSLFAGAGTSFERFGDS